MCGILTAKEFSWNLKENSHAAANGGRYENFRSFECSHYHRFEARSNHRDIIDDEDKVLRLILSLMPSYEHMNSIFIGTWMRL